MGINPVWLSWQVPVLGYYVMLCFIQPENRVLLFWCDSVILDMYLIKQTKVLELLKTMVLFMDQHLDR